METKNKNAFGTQKLDDERRIRVLSPGMLVFKRFVRNRLAITGLVILILMFAFSFLGGILSPYGQSQVFKHDEEIMKEYATCMMSTDMRFTVRPGAEFPETAHAEAMLAISKGNTSFTYGERTYSLVREGEEFYTIGDALKIASTRTLAGKFSLPSWAERYSLLYNETQAEVETLDGYLILKKTFSTGDSIKLSLPLKLRLVPETAGVTVHYGALLLALPVAAEARVLRGTPPFADYAFFPREEWRFGIAEALLWEAEIVRRTPGKLPFDADAPPLTVCLPLVPAPQWRMRQNSAGSVPGPYTAARANCVHKTLIPYGCTQLRIAQFPIAILQEEPT